jgi:hypothetical protein
MSEAATTSTSSTAEDIKEKEREREVAWVVDRLTAINEKCKLIHNADSGIIAVLIHFMAFMYHSHCHQYRCKEIKRSV